MSIRLATTRLPVQPGGRDCEAEVRRTTDQIARAILGDESDQDPELTRYIEARERIRGKHMKELVECYSKALGEAVNRELLSDWPDDIDLRANRWDQ